MYPVATGIEITWLKCRVSGVAVCGWVRGSVGGAGRHMGKRVVQWRMHVTKIEAELHSSSTGVCTSQKCHADNVPLVNV